MTTTAPILKKVDTLLKKSLRQELKEQGHYLTGALEKSIVGEIKSDGKKSQLTGKALSYAEDLETGIPGSQINIPTSLYEMTKYVELRMGYSGNKATFAAYMILKKQKQEGNPTSGSYAFSKNGERKHFISNTNKETSSTVDKIVSDGMDRLIDKEFSKQKSETI